MKKETKLLSIRQYAKKLGTSHPTVIAAIDAGHIVEGYDPATKRINPDVADMEWGVDFMQRKLTKEFSGKSRDVVSNDDDWNPFDEDSESSDIPYNTRINELIRIEMLYKARMAKVKLAEKLGTLVSKEETYREMFELGKEIRVNMQAIPDRIIDELLTLNRNEAHRLLLENINQVLEKLADNEDSN